MRNFQFPTSTRTTDNTYFEEGRKGELNQLKKLFQQTIGTDDHQSRNKLIKTIIAHTTLGVDTSRFFPQMILAAYTNDITEKKLIYFYLSIYAEKYPDTALMAINTFHKDCLHSDHRIRGLSLKSLCNMKFKGAYEYIYPRIQQALDDRQAYVRRCAVLGVAKVYRMHPAIKQDIQLLDKLYALIKDDDKIVASNSIQTLNQLLHEEGGVVVTQKMAAYLLNNLGTFSQFAQVLILQTIQKYTPSAQNELIVIMNILDNKLKHSSSALVLATIKIFLKYITIKDNLKQPIFQRIKQPLLFLINSQQGFEGCYVVLEHIRYLITNVSYSKLLIPYYKTFFCNADEPTYTRTVKIQILQHLTSNTNISDIINELDEYVNDEQIISRVAVKALGVIAMNVEIQHTRLIMKMMLKKVVSGTEWVCNQMMIALENILRKYPQQFSIVKIHLQNLIIYTTDPNSKASLLSMIARSQQPIPQLTEYIEGLIQSQNKFNQYPALLKKQLLHSCLSQFFKSPSYQIKAMLSKLFQLFLSSQTQIHLKDLASLYYIAMMNNLEQFKTSFMIKRDFIQISKSQDIELMFNTFQIPFRKPSQLFLSKQIIKLNILQIDTDQIGKQQEQLKQIIIDLNPRFKILQVDDFEEQFQLQTDKFEELWQSTQQGACITRIVSSDEIESITQENMQQLFRLWRIFTIASSQQQSSLKMYFYGKQANKAGEEENIGLMEMQVNKEAKVMTLTTKCENQQFAGFVSKYVQEFLKINDII